MATFDPSVISTIGDQPDIGSTVQKAFTLKDMMDEQSLNKMKLREAAQSEKDTSTARDIFSKGDITSAEGAAKVAQRFQQAGLGDKAMDVLKAQQMYQSGQYEQQLQQLNLYNAALNFHSQQFDPIYQRATEMRTATGPDGKPKFTDAEITAYITSQIPTVVKNIKDAPDSLLPPDIKKAALQKATQTQSMNYQQLQDTESATEQGRAKLKAQMEALNMQSEIGARGQARDTAQAGLQERERHDRAMEGVASQRQGTEQEIDKSAKAIANYQMAPPTGASRSPAAVRLMAKVMEINPDFDANQYQSRRKAESDFATGKQGQAVKSFNVALSHLDVLSQAGDALKNGNVKLFNKVAQSVASQTGNPAPTDFNAVKHIVGDEIVKAIVGSGGGVADRENAAKTVDAANSPAQLAGVINRYKQLMKGQLDGLKKQYSSTTGREDFDKFLTPEAQTDMQPPAAATPPQAAPAAPQGNVVDFNSLPPR